MALIKSISGIRGTIGGYPGDGLGSVDIVKFTCSFAQFLKKNESGRCRIVVGRDARLSGEMINNLVTGAIMSMGADVIDIGLATTPTVELAVTGLNASGGIIITASHNPKQWNALKLLDSNGEFLSNQAGMEVVSKAEKEDFEYASVENLGKLYIDYTWTLRHIEMVKNLKLVDCAAIRKANLKVAVDAVNSVGGIAIPMLLKELGVNKIIELNCEATGKFAHIPEPIPENLTDISALMKKESVDVGFVVDPDVDRLAIIMENGEFFIEENTLVSIADYVLSENPGNTVSNLSSSRALKDVTLKHGGEYFPAAVGEVNVVEKMKSCNAVIGGEGNGGVIYPELHYGRDALVGVALFLTMLAKSGKRVSEIKSSLPKYQIVKNKIELSPEINVDKIIEHVKHAYSHYPVNDIDGVKIDFPDKWVHLRKSNTEPIIRIYAEAHSEEEALELVNNIKEVVKQHL